MSISAQSDSSAEAGGRRAAPRGVVFEAAAGAFCLAVEAFLVLMCLVWGIGNWLGLGDAHLAAEAAVAGVGAAVCGVRLFGVFRGNLLEAERDASSART